MTDLAVEDPARDVRPPGVLVWTLGAFLATSSIVMFEPAPCDLLFFAAAALALIMARTWSSLPLGVGVLGSAAVYLAATLVSLCLADDLVHALRFAGITIYMFALAYLVASVVGRFGPLILRPMYLSFSLAALSCATIGILARFHWIPNAQMFFRDASGARVKSTFKDPNVFGPFLIAAILWTLVVMLERRRVSLAAVGALSLYLLGILFSFSRGAYLNLAVTLTVFLMLVVFVVRKPQVTRRLAASGCLLMLVTPAVLGFALAQSSLAEHFTDRLSVQSYDSERFGTQREALEVAVTAPLGIGPGEFRKPRFRNATHNLYLRVLVENGWIGIVAFVGFLIATMMRGLDCVLARGRFALLEAAMLAIVSGSLFESVVIDTLHWRHLFLMIGILLGLWLYTRNEPGAEGNALTFEELRS